MKENTDHHWMFLEEGETRGPVGIQTLWNRIQQRQLGAFDFICKDGEGYWKSASDFQEFKVYFQSMDQGGDWVVLRNESGKYVQRGLFSTNELRTFLKNGLVRSEDFTWRAGMTQWCRVSELDIFKAPLEDHSHEAQDNKDVNIFPEDKFLSSIMLEPLTEIPRSDEIPEEAEGPDLT